MKLLNSLCAIYLAAASSYSVAIVLARDPALTDDLRDSALFAAREGGDAAVALNDHLLQPGWVLLARQTGSAIDALRLAEAVPKPAPVEAPAPAARPVRVAAAPPKLRLYVPAQTVQPAPKGEPERVAEASPPRMIAAPVKPLKTVEAAAEPALSIPPPPAPLAALDDHAASQADQAKVEERLKASLPKELLANFDLFIYVSKADKGPVAQRMYVYDKGAGDRLTLRYDWPVSTGREAYEYNDRGQRLGTHTPAGYYELDPHRMYRHYTSGEWHVPMPYAMFFNWVHGGDLTGLAIHSAWGAKEVAALGSRDSAGCVRLSPENARRLFELVHDRYAGLEARFATDRRTGTMSNKGVLAHDAAGKLRFVKGYRVLVLIEDFGGKDVVAIM